MKIITDGTNTEGYFGPCQISMMKQSLRKPLEYINMKRQTL